MPPVIAKVSNGAEVFSVKFNLQLELNNSQASKAVEFALAQIMESVIDEIQNTNASDPKRSKQIQVLRQALRQKIQDAMGSNILMAFAISFLPILITTARGLKEVEPDLIDLVRVLRATRWQIFTKIQLPGSLPYIVSGMKVAVVLAVAGAIVEEFIASEEGFGYLMMQRQVELDTASMFMAVLLITLIGSILYGIVILLEKFVVPQDARIG